MNPPDWTWKKDLAFTAAFLEFYAEAASDVDDPRIERALVRVEERIAAFRAEREKVRDQRANSGAVVLPLARTLPSPPTFIATLERIPVAALVAELDPTPRIGPGPRRRKAVVNAK